MAKLTWTAAPCPLKPSASEISCRCYRTRLRSTPARPAKRQPQDQARRDRPRRAPAQARLDPHQGGDSLGPLSRDQGHRARPQAGHCVRRSLLPQLWRVLEQGHDDLRDHGQQMYAPLPLLRCPHGPARPSGPGRFARRRRRPFCALHPAHTCAGAQHHHRDPDTLLWRAAGPRAGNSGRCATGRAEPAAALQGPAAPTMPASRRTQRACFRGCPTRPAPPSVQVRETPVPPAQTPRRQSARVAPRIRKSPARASRRATC
jgi:hypothetical protein